jgi:hypothetical protein
LLEGEGGKGEGKRSQEEERGVGRESKGGLRRADKEDGRSE